MLHNPERLSHCAQVLLALVAALALIGTPAPADEKPEAQPGQTAQEEKGESKEKEEKEKKKDKSKEPKRSVTEGAVTIAGKEVRYTATAGKIIQQDDKQDPKAEIFFIAYTAGGLGEDGAPQIDATRPVTFCFNGGPGSSSVWLHLGMLGPQRVRMPDDASFPAPPFHTVDNPYSLLDTTDLVFIDPVGTGYSRPAEDEKREQFHGLEEDLRSVGQFIHDYTTEFRRWESPKFVLGESYGGLRAGGLAEHLQDRYSMYLNGIVIISGVLDFATLHFAENNDLPYIVFLPTYAATAWRHKALDDELLAKPVEDVVAEAEEFAFGPYADALLRGASMSEEERNAVAAEMARLTGLSVEYVRDAHLRVKMWQFSKELLRTRGQLIGRYDSRYVGPGFDRIGEAMDYDPSDAAISGIFSGAMNGYLRGVLDYEDDRVYEILSSSVHPWSYKPFENRYVTTAGRLSRAMTQNPYLRVFAACGYYDLATPGTAMKHTRDHALLLPGQQERFTMGFYEGGHMMYIHEPSLVKLRSDLLEFYEQSAP